MSALLRFATVMDWISEKFGKLAGYAVLFATLVLAGNALIRCGFDFNNAPTKPAPPPAYETAP
ncbi:TRAP-type mannitol/chloroaromatic compound transport system permease small subunit [Variovorax sp. GrIS 2.14]|uniref:hypothetical protein n=1 Tax=Variovorax sp. GrIS 2.14 TaxID=3071709 RepID=UPI0038F5FB48